MVANRADDASFCGQNPRKFLIINLIVYTSITCFISLVPFKITHDYYKQYKFHRNDTSGICYDTQDEANGAFNNRSLSVPEEKKILTNETESSDGNGNVPVQVPKIRSVKKVVEPRKDSVTMTDKMQRERRFVTAGFIAAFFDVLLIAVTALLTRLIMIDVGKPLYFVVGFYMALFVVQTIFTVLYSYHMLFHHEEAGDLNPWKTIGLVSLLYFYMTAVCFKLGILTKRAVDTWSINNPHVRVGLTTDECDSHMGSRNLAKSHSHSHNSLQRFNR